ncbi:outer membrane receptor protein involved in Fe transport [Novosphingobium capsulatum]|uniref:Outer membrane receptor protein involved in Fe transport n=1 Tax=Novosphingobium capsulatum TaxID=13688 RepID=A0ABU1MNF1_9SPHN|nr:outer membrane receptor protein involved in Fe transport [Novosphingobium capsulatum]
MNWQPAQWPALGLNAGVYCTGARYADVLDQGGVPAYATLSLGARYKVMLPRARTLILRANADNVTNKRYWATGGTTLYAGAGRTLRLSANVGF